MNNRLLEMYRGVAVHATANLEHQAALELLALVMLADQDIADEEVELVREISTDWHDDEFSFEDYLRPAIEAARHAIERDRVQEFIDSIDERINSRVLRSALFSASREVAGVDNEVNPEEGSILAAVAVRFN
ncbi:TerB family tellurite resistance protein [Ilumatobacter sp.]|uniref:TerB family tellurite resistance protein n=1 Tax=Ilumatobacter sp. TaxID=1967498 RepID=UPI003751F2FA